MKIIEDFWLKCLEDGDFDEIIASLKNLDSKGMEPSYYFIKTISDLYDQEKCSHENLDKANKLYYRRLKIMPSDY